jgi:uncharacterized Zn-finger protein
VCSKDFSRNDLLKKHYRTHIGTKIYKCEICNKHFSQKENHVIHSFIHTGKNPYTCEVCNRMLSQGGHLNAHKLIHTGEKPYSCDVCSKTFPVREKLRRHYRIHTGEKPYECTVCERSFVELGNLKRHHSRVHDREMPDSVWVAEWITDTVIEVLCNRSTLDKIFSSFTTHILGNKCILVLFIYVPHPESKEEFLKISLMQHIGTDIKLLFNILGV